MKHLLWIAAGILLTAGIAALILRQTTGQFHLRELGIVTAIIFVSAQVAMIPLFLTRGASPVAVFQAAFGGTVIHLFLTLALGAAVHMMHWADRGMFLFLLLGFYWFSLIFVITAMIKIFRQSVPQSQSGSGQVAKGT